MKNFSKLTSVLGIIFAFVLIVFFVFPTRSYIAELKNQKTEISGKLQGSQSELESLQNLSKDIASKDSSKKALINSVPVDPAQDAWIVELESILKAQNFTLNSIGFSQVQDKVFGNVLSASINASGPYDSVVVLIQKFENAKRLSKISSLNLQRTDQASVSLTMTVDAYYQGAEIK